MYKDTGDDTPRLYDITDVTTRPYFGCYKSSPSHTRYNEDRSFNSQESECSKKDVRRENRKLKKRAELLKRQLAQLMRIEKLVNDKDGLIESLELRIVEEKEERKDLLKSIEHLLTENANLRDKVRTKPVFSISNSLKSLKDKLRQLKD